MANYRIGDVVRIGKDKGGYTKIVGYEGKIVEVVGEEFFDVEVNTEWGKEVYGFTEREIDGIIERGECKMLKVGDKVKLQGHFYMITKDEGVIVEVDEYSERPYEVEVDTSYGKDELSFTEEQVVKIGEDRGEDKMYKAGDKVRIVEERTYTMNFGGAMDKYLGTVMTIKEETDGNSFSMEEDGGRWSWGLHDIAEKVEEERGEDKVFEVGDKVKIVGERTRTMNDEGAMDKYLGTVMTISRVGHGDVKMEEDGGRWFWFKADIEGKVKTDKEGITVGDLVLIKEEITENIVEQMEEYAGAVGTVAEIDMYGMGIRIKEDNGEWFWNWENIVLDEDVKEETEDMMGMEEALKKLSEIFGEGFGEEVETDIEKQGSYEVGDVVRIRRDLEEDGEYGRNSVVSEMLELKGEDVEIIEKTPIGQYRLEGDDGRWNWTNEMFLGKVVEEDDTYYRDEGLGGVEIEGFEYAGEQRDVHIWREEVEFGKSQEIIAIREGDLGELLMFKGYNFGREGVYFSTEITFKDVEEFVGRGEDVIVSTLDDVLGEYAEEIEDSNDITHIVELLGGKIR